MITVSPHAPRVQERQPGDTGNRMSHGTTGKMAIVLMDDSTGHGALAGQLNRIPVKFNSFESLGTDRSHPTVFGGTDRVGREHARVRQVIVKGLIANPSCRLHADPLDLA